MNLRGDAEMTNDKDRLAGATHELEDELDRTKPFGKTDPEALRKDPSEVRAPRSKPGVATDDQSGPQQGSAEDTESLAADNQNRPLSTPSPAPQKVAGAGPAIAERSKDAKAPAGTAARQPGAFKKDR
jgi:hypothetical protein